MAKRNISDHQRYLVQKYVKEHYDRIELVVPKGYRDILKNAAKENNTTVARLLVSGACIAYGLEPPKYPCDDKDDNI